MTETEAADPVLAPPQSVQPAPQRRRSGFWGGVLGGVLAAGGGFALAQYVPNGWPLANVAALQTDLAAQGQAIGTLKTTVGQLAETATPPDITPLSDRIAALESAAATPAAPIDLAPLEARIAALETRMTAIEALPTGDAGVSAGVIVAQDAAIRDLQASLQALKAAPSAAALSPEAQAQIKAAADAAAAMQTDAARLLTTIKTTAALGRIQAAMDSGAPFASALADIGDAPAALSDRAATGVATLADLKAGFPDAARAALEAALQADMGESWSDRVANFLRAQTGARSLTPRDGTDPDAILSRAEAAVDAGDLTTALAELATLPEPAQAPLADWRARATAREAALAAATALAATLGQ